MAKKKVAPNDLNPALPRFMRALGVKCQKHFALIQFFSVGGGGGVG